MKSTKNKIITTVFLSLFAVSLLIIITEMMLPSLFTKFEAKTLDWRYSTRMKKLYRDRGGAPIDDILIVDIDRRSLEKLGPFSQWPRKYHADVIEYITSGNAYALGFDILFMEPSLKVNAEIDPELKVPIDDASLIRATQRSDIVYHSISFSQADPNVFIYPMDRAPAGFAEERFTIELPETVAARLKEHDRFDGKILKLYNAARGIGYANFDPDNDSVIRTMPLFQTFAGRQYFAFSLAIVYGLLNLSPEHIEVLPGERITLTPPGTTPEENVVIPIDKKGRMLINYMGAYKTFRYLPYYDVLMRRVPAEMFEGRIVLVGTSAAGLFDIRPVPMQGAFPGVEIHANIIYNILTENYITTVGKSLSYFLCIALVMLVSLMAIFLNPRISIPAALLLTIAYVLISFNLFAYRAIWIENIRPVLGVLVVSLTVYVYRYSEEDRNRRKIKGMFQYYLSQSVVDELIRNPQMLKLGGERRIATAFFMDIQNFTTYSEELTPEQLMAQLNEYLSAMTAIVLAYEGFLDKYEGDAIMAIFGVPVDQPDHALRACQAALEMQDVLTLLRKKWRDEGKPEFCARIGINSGPMIAGNIGGAQRFDYTVIGDAVNLASRIEGVNKIYGTNILVSEFTRQLLDGIKTRELDFIRVKGKTEPVKIYEVIAPPQATLDESTVQKLERYARGLQLYRQKKWAEAIAEFEKCLRLDPGDGPSKVFIERCAYFRETSVLEDWDGVFEMESK